MHFFSDNACYFLLSNLDNFKPQLFTPNLKTIQNPCLSLDPGWFLFSPNRNHRKRFGLRMNLIAAIINHELGF
ncbi:IS1380-Spn1 transposase [Streptococcus pneumoniae]|nr:IS1380-Spn1 transposase [Streptococcus pneumoniae]